MLTTSPYHTENIFWTTGTHKSRFYLIFKLSCGSLHHFVVPDYDRTFILRNSQTTCRFKYHWNMLQKKTKYLLCFEREANFFLSNYIPIGWFCWVTISCCSNHPWSEAFTIKSRNQQQEWLTLSEHTALYSIVCITPSFIIYFTTTNQIGRQYIIYLC